MRCDLDRSHAPILGMPCLPLSLSLQPGDHIAFRYEIIGVLGRGSFGQASLGVLIRDSLEGCYQSLMPTLSLVLPPFQSRWFHDAGSALPGSCHRAGGGTKDHSVSPLGHLHSIVMMGAELSRLVVFHPTS